MKILLLGPLRPSFEEFLGSNGDEVIRTDDKLTADSPVFDGVDWVVSYGYRYIIKDEVLRRFPRRFINLHIAYLPWNRGADPNLWSFLEDTPKGVTIHYMDAGVDTGDIIAREQVSMLPDDTLRSSYERLSRAIEDLFRRVWADVRDGRLVGRRQPDGGTAHRLKDKAAYEHLLTSGWDTPVSALIGRAAGRS